jgi:hypothetical protein
VKHQVLLRASTLVALALLATACSGRMDVTSYEPGVYKGPADPLLDTHATAEHKALLQARFTKGQSDR